MQLKRTYSAPLARLGLVALLTTAGLGAGAEPAPVCRDLPAPDPWWAPAHEMTPAGPRPDRGSRLASGLRVQVDPRTGALVTPPPAKSRSLELSPAVRQALSTSDEGLVEVVLPGGTVRVRLEGRFMSAAFATLGEDGEVRVGHGLGAAPPREDRAETDRGGAIDEAP